MDRPLTDKERFVLESFGCEDTDGKATAITEEAILQKVANFDSMPYSWKRQKEYPSINELIVALWENVIEERAASVIELEAKRQDVKTKYPKS